MKLREVVLCVIIGMLLAGGAYLTYKTISGNNRIKTLTSELTACRNAPVKIDTIHDSIIIAGKVIIKPIPVKVIIHDSVFIPYKQSFYDSIFQGDGWRFRYQAIATGSLDLLTFSDFVIPKEVITIRSTVDTCINKVIAKQPTFRWGVYTGLTLNSFKTFPGIEAGGQVVIKDQITIGAGGLVMNGLYGNVRVGWIFKK